MRVLGLHHAQITVDPADVEAARAFYIGVLGLTETPKPESLAGRGGFWLAVGDRQVHVGVEAGVERARTKAHLAYEVADLAAARRQVEAAGVKLIDSVPIPGYDRCECRDPFGNRVELIQRLG